MPWRTQNYVRPSRKIDGKTASQTQATMRILNVAEKPSAAKTISNFLSNGRCRTRNGLSKYNKIYEFDYDFNGQRAMMAMTSVSGHLLGFEFKGHYRKWSSCSPEELFDVPVIKECSENFRPIRVTLQNEVRKSDILIIWTDYDREGENIGFEIDSVCREVKGSIATYRAVFSDISQASVRNAMAHLLRPDKRLSDAVDVRSELDLRIGAAFTRFQTLRLKQVFPNKFVDSIISYGSCQFPTMGFVVQRYKEMQAFIPELFWKLKVTHKQNNLNVEFLWKRVRLFDELCCRVLHERCSEPPRVAKVENVETKPKSKWRPVPMDTIELEKIACRKFKISAKETMHIAERLYNRGFISYPRTETNIFPKNMDFQILVNEQIHDGQWGQFAQRILQEGPNPRQGKKSDGAHPPIHPTKYTTGLDGNEKRVYELIVRHFLACLSKDAEGFETTVQIDIREEKFVASGLQIVALNYLEVYPYEKWTSKEIPVYTPGQTFTPSSLDMEEGQTAGPKPLTEADLISLMDKYGIGTDATHAEHIAKVKDRQYVKLEDQYLFPQELGLGLVDGYDSMGHEQEMSKPTLRAELEKDLKKICDGVKDPKVVLQQQINIYRQVFKKTVEQAKKLDGAIGKYLNSQPTDIANNVSALVGDLPEYVLKCPCGFGMLIRNRESGTKFISCSGFPNCRNAIWLPSKVVDVKLADGTCNQCGPDTHLLAFTFRPGSMAPFYPDIFTGCLGGCDDEFVGKLELQRSLTGDGGANNQTNRPVNNVPINAPNITKVNANQRALPSQIYIPTTDSAQNRPNNAHWNNSSINNNQWRNNIGNLPQNNNQWSNANQRQNNRNRLRNGNQWNSVTQGESNPRNLNNDVDDEDVQCNCGIQARRLTVNKETENKGKQFYGCSKAMDDPGKCNFFMWATGRPLNSNQITNYNNNQNMRFGNGNNFQNNGFKARNRAKQFRTTAGSTRKCGLCREEGHNKKNCPNRNMDGND